MTTEGPDALLNQTGDEVELIERTLRPTATRCSSSTCCTLLWRTPRSRRSSTGIWFATITGSCADASGSSPARLRVWG